MNSEIKRTRSLNQKQIDHSQSETCIVYWMMRDHRVHDNWALLEAQKRAIQLGVPLVVLVTLRTDLQKHSGTRRMLSVLLGGLQDVEKNCLKHTIGFSILLGDPIQTMLDWVHEHKPYCLVTDFSPLKPYRQWSERVAQLALIPVLQVDAHNSVPCWVASEKKEWAARTFRPKLQRLLPEYLTDFPQLQEMSHSLPAIKKCDWQHIFSAITVDESVPAVSSPEPGSSAGLKALESFIADGLDRYHLDKNDPSLACTSRLSAYLHFGHISAQRVALQVQRAQVKEAAKEAFLEELIVRRELSDNFCFYESHYDSLDGAPAWAQKTLQLHADDQREHLYTLSELEEAKTHDPAWNAAQQQLNTSGYMHGYMRMYWAKKILEWSPSATEAVRRAIYLNDRLQLDGRDPNGYVGILWSIAGLHDRPWFERSIFGTVRYMSASGLHKKFDIATYNKTWSKHVQDSQ